MDYKAITAFKGLGYINTIIDFVESHSQKLINKQFFFPKYIYRGVTKEFYTNQQIEAKDQSIFDSIFNNNKADNNDTSCTKSYGINDAKLAFLRLFGNKEKKNATEIIEFINSPEFYSMTQTNIEDVKNNDLLKKKLCHVFKYLIPKEIKSGALIRLELAKEDKKNNSDISFPTSEYLHYIKGLITEMKNSYPEYSDYNDLEILAELQHKGGASCLVDFSNNLLISLWFATQGDVNDIGYLYMYDINADSFMKDNISFISKDNSSKDIEELLMKTRKTTTFLTDTKCRFWSWRPSNINMRIARQDSVFIFGIEPFLIKEHNIVVIPILPTWKLPIQSALKVFFGITAETIYPDSDGFATSHSKTKAIMLPTLFINPKFIKSLNNTNTSQNDEEESTDLKDVDILQYGISDMIKGQYDIALKSFHRFEAKNKAVAASFDKINDSKANTKTVFIETWYSIAYCYAHINQSELADMYFAKAFRLTRELLTGEKANDDFSGSSPIDYPVQLNTRRRKYLNNKLLKISDDYLGLLYNVKSYQKAYNIVTLLNHDDIQKVSPIVLYTVTCELSLLALLSGKPINLSNSPIKYELDENKSKLCGFIKRYCEYITECCNFVKTINAAEKKKITLQDIKCHNKSESMKNAGVVFDKLNEDMTSTHAMEKNASECVHWVFDDLENAVKEYFNEYPNLLYQLMRTLSVMKNYQEIQWSYRNIGQ